MAAGQAQWLASGWKAASGATVHCALCTGAGALCTGAGAPPQVCEPGRNLAHRPTSHNTAAKEKTPFLLPKVITFSWCGGSCLNQYLCFGILRLGFTMACVSCFDPFVQVTLKPPRSDFPFPW